MSPRSRATFVALTGLLRRRYPGIDDPTTLVRDGHVLVDGAPVLNPRAQVRSDARLQLVRTRPLRGTLKLRHALGAFAIQVSGMVVVDVGAAAGGFTRALLDAGAARVYAVDVGVGQLRGALRAHPRVVNLEGTNLARLDDSVVPECVDLVTMDLSYLAVANAVRQLDREQRGAGLGAHLARLEATILFEELLPRIRSIELAGPTERIRSNFVNGIKRMPVRIVTR